MSNSAQLAELVSQHELAEFCSGFGQHHSERVEVNPRPYNRVTWHEITEMMTTPPSVAKGKAQWVIFSDIASREVKEQREKGAFYCLWADLDEAPTTLEHAVHSLAESIGADVYGYTSRSATEVKQKGRLLVPLDKPVSGEQFELLQECLNDRLGALELAPDRATESANQLCYLPNRGEFYATVAVDYLGPLDVGKTFIGELEAKEAAEREQAEIDRQLAEQAAAKRQARLDNLKTQDQASPVDAYNDAHPLDSELERCGFRRKGRRYLSPYSSSGGAAVILHPDGKLWCSHHQSDIDAGVGQRSGRVAWGDAFDLFCHFDHGGDYSNAVRAAGDMLTVNGVSITQHNRQAYKQAQSATERVSSHSGGGEEVTVAVPGDGEKPFDLSMFSLSGMAGAMEAKMLEDTFVLEDLAIAGQMTGFYAKPNTGKTLIILRMLMDRVKAGDIHGKDVFYINADDNYRGLVTKLKIAEQYGFHMLAPGHNGFESHSFIGYLRQMIEDDTCSGKIIILDTLKKFMDLMDKQAGTTFLKAAREFVSHNGTIIMLAHTNKHRDSEGKLIPAGTSDVVDDCDCAYMIDALETGPGDTRKTVNFENFKSRGDVADSASYSYSIEKGQDYRSLLDSVSRVSEDQAQEAARLDAISKKLDANADLIEILLEVLAQGSANKTELVGAAVDAGFSRRKVNLVIREHTGTNYLEGHRWRAERGEKNEQVFSRLLSLDAAYTPVDDDPDDWG